MKKIILIVFASAIAFTVILSLVLYHSEAKGLEYRFNEKDNTYTVVGIGTCTDNVLNIPSLYNDFPVTEIDANVFYGCTSLK